MLFRFDGAGPHRALHSFPTRRSSDLTRTRRGELARVSARDGYDDECSDGDAFREPGHDSLRSQILTIAQREGSNPRVDRKSTRLNSSHRCISYAVFCLKKNTNKNKQL